MGRKLGASLLGRGLGGHLTQSRLAQAYLSTKWHLDASSRLATIEMGRKIGGGALPPFWGWELGPHLALCGLDELDEGLSPYQLVAS